MDTPPAQQVFEATPEQRAAAARVMARCDELASISSLDDGIYRSFLTPEHARCNARVAGWLEEAGLAAWQDAAGNLCGRLAAPGDGPRRTLMLGSHLDTVRNAGSYDGILGVLVALEAMAGFHAAGEALPFHVDLLGFGDEEGARFGTTLLGSRAVAGSWDPAWFDLRDGDGTTLGEALGAFGCDPAAIGSASRAGEELVGYLEVHIEQGPVLEDNDQPLGVVPSIAGARRFRVRVSGRAGHAGTVPMNMRQDALVAAASAVHLVERIADRFEIVATVGQLQCYPGAPNVIPGDCEFTVDIRAGRDHTRDLAVEALTDELARLIGSRGMRVAWEETHRAPAVECASWLQRVLENAVLDLGLNPVSIVSGAGHDAMSLAELTDVGMLFVRCAGGISHHPAESVAEEDVAAALAALELTLRALAAREREENP
ncbi:MAG: allantoate amidohydrolase [Pseudohaliea sp.]